MGIFTAITTALASGTFLASVGTFILQTAVGVGLNLLASAIAGKPDAPEQRQFSIQGSLRAGGDVPRSFLLGRTATAGSLVYANTWGDSGKTPNAYFTQVIALSDIPSQALEGILVNGERCTFRTSEPHPQLGIPIVEYRTGGEDRLWVKFYDGTQTTADPFLVSTVGNDERPYENTRVGTGVSYVICSSRIDEEMFTGFPTFKFELYGAKLYDPSRDSTVGGVGAQRLANPSTWGGDGDELPAVQAYNLFLGIEYDSEWFYGLQNMSANRLPPLDWISQINKCRLAVDKPGGGTEYQYLSGLEIQLSAPLADATEAILSSCQGRIIDSGGFYKIRLGAPDASVYSFTDGNILSTEKQTFSPFFGLADTINGISATYPEPAEGWNSKAAPSLYRPDFEIQDGRRRLMSSVELSAVRRASQVQRLMKSALEEARRARRVTVTLDPSAWALEPGDVVTMNSVRNGFVDKLMRVDGILDKANLDIIVDLTEVDPSDYDWNPATDYTPPVFGPIGVIRPPAQAIVDWAVLPWSIEDATGGPRRPALRVSWDGTQDDVVAVYLEVRLAETGEVVYRGRTDNVAAGNLVISQNLLPDEDYEVRGKYIPGGDRITTYSAWLAVKTPNVKFTGSDILAGAITELELADRAVTSVKIQIEAITTELLSPNSVTNTKIADAAVIASKIANEAVTNLKLADQAVSTAKIQLAAVTQDIIANNAVVTSKIQDGAINTAKFASGIQPVGIVAGSTVPTTKTTEVITVNGKLYRWSGSAYTAAVPTVDLTGQIIANQIADGAVNTAKFAAGIEPVGIIAGSTVPTTKTTEVITVNGKLYRWNGTAYVASVPTADLTGQIISGQIADLAITNAKLAALAVDAAKLATNAVTETKIADNAISTPKLQANSIIGDKIAANTISVTNMIMADFNNRVENPNFGEGDKGWVKGPGVFIYNAAANAYIGDYYMQFTTGATSAVTRNNNIFPVVPGEVYRLTVVAGAVGGVASTTLYGRVRYMGADKNTLVGASNVMTFTSADAGYVTKTGEAIVPAGAVYAWVDFNIATLTSGSYRVGFVSCQRKDAAQLIVDGGIITNHLASGAITADKLAANSIIAGKIAAGAVSTTELAAGAITADKMAIGRGANYIENSDLYAGLTTWGVRYTNDGAAFTLTLRNDTYAAGGVALQLYQNNATAGRIFDVGPFDVSTGAMKEYAVESGKRYQFSVYGYAHRANRTLWIGWRDAAGAELNYVSSPAVTPENSDPQSKLSNYTRSVLFAVAPPTAVRAVVFVRHNGTITGSGTNSYVWLRNAFFGEADVNQTEPSPWTPSGTTLVDAGQIITGAVIASKIAALAITGDKIAANAVTTDKLAANSVTAAKIVAGTITGTEIAASAITARELALIDLNNLVPDSAFAGGLSAWQYAQTGWVLGATTTFTGSPKGAVYTNPSVLTGYAGFVSQKFPVKAGENYRLSWRMKSSGSATVWGRVDYYDTSGAAVNGWSTPPYSVPITAAEGEKFVEINIPANANCNGEAEFRLYVQRTGMAVGQTVEVIEPRVQLRNGASLIVDGTIVTNHLAALSITTGKIAAGAVTATELATNSVTAVKIAAATITGDKIAANTIASEKLIAGSITARELLLTDWENMIPDGNFNNASGADVWELNTGTWANNTVGAWYWNGDSQTGQYSLILDNGVNNGTSGGSPPQINIRTKDFIPVTTGDTLAWEITNITTNGSSAVGHYYRILWYNRAKAALASPVYTDAVNNGSIPSTWTTRKGLVTVPAGAAFCKVQIYLNNNAPTRYNILDRISLRKAKGAELIVDGTITASMIVAGSITATQLGAGAVTAVKIAAGAVTADKMTVSNLAAISATLGNVDISNANIGTLTVGTSNIQPNAATAMEAGDGYSVGFTSSFTTVAAVALEHGPGNPKVTVDWAVLGPGVAVEYRVLNYTTGYTMFTYSFAAAMNNWCCLAQDVSDKSSVTSSTYLLQVRSAQAGSFTHPFAVIRTIALKR